MLILENKTVDNNAVKRIIQTAKDYFDNEDYKFDVDITDSLNIWCDNDKDHTVFIQTSDENAYATFTEADIEVFGVAELVKNITQQLTETGLDND